MLILFCPAPLGALGLSLRPWCVGVFCCRCMLNLARCGQADISQIAVWVRCRLVHWVARSSPLVRCSFMCFRLENALRIAHKVWRSMLSCSNLLVFVVRHSQGQSALQLKEVDLCVVCRSLESAFVASLVWRLAHTWLLASY